MKKRGFVGTWQNRHWAGAFSGYNAGLHDPDIPSGGTGELPDFLTFTIKGTGYDYYYDGDGDRHSYISELCFVSPVMINQNGVKYRFCVLYVRSSHTAQDSTCYFTICQCDTTGRIYGGRGGNNTWVSEIGTDSTVGSAFLLWSGEAKEKWAKISAEIPYIENNAYNMMIGKANAMYTKVTETSYDGTIEKELLSMKIYAISFWSSEPIYWYTPDTSLSEIVQRAQSLGNYKYWYGGAGQVATKALADELKASYGGVWTQSYYNKALNDIGQRVADCSYLVNYAYGTASPGNHGIGTSQYLSRYSKWNGVPKNGMIAWRNGHTGIYYNGKTIEMVGIDYDYMERDYVKSEWTCILYDPNRKY